jgi:ADP-ribose pyrophosphatase YjhB (NUDIX family)
MLQQNDCKKIAVLSDLLNQALEYVLDAKNGLPQELFYFVSQLTPLVNVDLLIKNKSGQTLLTWRQDQFYGPAWHIPGGIVRFKERIEDRIIKVAKTEVGCGVKFSPDSICFRQIISERNVRGHFISLLYLCELDGAPELSKQCYSSTPTNGQWHWHDIAPDNLLSCHEPYRQFINDTLSL